MNKISYSQISMFNECPQRWKLNYIDKLSIRESSIHLIFGTAMHEVLQTYLEVMYNDSIKNADILPLEEMFQFSQRTLHQLNASNNKELKIFRNHFS